MIRIAVTGPESTGKSELSRELANRLGATLVEEYAREYLESLNRPYILEDLSVIAEEQCARWQKAIDSGASILIADTEMTVIRIWSEFVFGVVPEKIVELQRVQAFDFYLLCDIDLPWVEDPLREHPFHRGELMDRYLMEINRAAYPYAVVRGVDKHRLTNALKSIQNSGLIQKA
jgi:nicotinamide riboside kinase